MSGIKLKKSSMPSGRSGPSWTRASTRGANLFTSLSTSSSMCKISLWL